MTRGPFKTSVPLYRTKRHHMTEKRKI